MNSLPQLPVASRKARLKKPSALPSRTSAATWPRLLKPGLQEFRAHGISHELAGEQIESSRRACERAEAIVNAELKRGLSGLATIGATAPVRRTLRNDRRYHQRIPGHVVGKRLPVCRQSPAVFPKPRHHGIRSVRGCACSVGVQHGSRTKWKPSRSR